MKTLRLSVKHHKTIAQHRSFTNKACWKCGVALAERTKGFFVGSATGLCKKCTYLARVRCPECDKICRVLGGRMHDHLKSLDRTRWVKAVKAAEFKEKE